MFGERHKLMYCISCETSVTAKRKGIYFTDPLTLILGCMTGFLWWFYLILKNKFKCTRCGLITTNEIP